jgi:two-component system NtrC family sensor kinase
MDAKQIFYNLPPFLTAALLAGMAVTAWRRGDRARGQRVFALFCFLGSLLYVDILIAFNAPSPRAALVTSRAAHLLHPFIIPLLIQFFHIFLNIGRRRWLVRLAYGYAVVTSACAPAGWIIASVRRFDFGYFGQAGPLFFLTGGGAAAATLYIVVLVYRAMVAETRAIEKNKLKYVFIGFGALTLTTSLTSLTVWGWPIYPPGVFGFIPLLVLAAGVFRYDLLDMGLLIRKGILYTTLTVLLTAVYLLIAVAFQAFFEALRLEERYLFPLALVAVIVLLSGPLKNRLGQAIERVLNKGHYDYRQTLRHVSQTIATVMDKRKITRLLQETIIDAMQVKSCALFQVDPGDGHYRAVAVAGEPVAVAKEAVLAADAQLIRYLNQDDRAVMKKKLMEAQPGEAAAQVLTQLSWLDAEVALPMRFRGELKGFLVMGEKRSGETFSSEDLDLLEPLCHQSAVAIENAHAYQALRQLNRTLEMRVAARTHDLQAALEEKERSQEQLIRSESLAAIGMVVAGVAHELNNPLTSVTSLLQSALEELRRPSPGPPVEPELIDDLLFADRELLRARAIVASLLGLSRQTQTYEESVHLNLVVQDTLRVLHNQCKHAAVKVVEELDADLPPLRGNFANLGQVVLNIIQNAIQAVTEPDGCIVLSTGLDAHRREVVFRCRDNGPGIDPAIRQHVFKPFFTTKPVGQGTGLGLYICHQIVQKHNGTMALEPAEPRGTVAIVRLPLTPKFTTELTSDHHPDYKATSYPS